MSVPPQCSTLATNYSLKNNFVLVSDGKRNLIYNIANLHVESLNTILLSNKKTSINGFTLSAFNKSFPVHEYL